MASYIKFSYSYRTLKKGVCNEYDLKIALTSNILHQDKLLKIPRYCITLVAHAVLMSLSIVRGPYKLDARPAAFDLFLFSHSLREPSRA